MTILDALRPPRGLKVLVTAGASGIGAGIACAFAAAGARVHVCDIDRGALDRLATRQQGITTSAADASVEHDVAAVFDDVRATLGGLDVLVNNAGIAGPTGPVESLDLAQWERTVAVNLNSQFLFARHGVPLLKQSSANPSVIAMSSVAGRLGYALRTPYAASKWAIVGLMKSLAIELGPAGVRVNAILPGPVAGDRMDAVIAARAASTGQSVQATREGYLRQSSLRRMVEVEDVAALALFLCTPGARYLSGQAISVDGNLEYL